MNRREHRAIRVGLAVGIFLGLAGCQATVPPAPAETVGTLAPSYNSIAVAPVHESTPPPSETYAVRVRRERQSAPSAAVDAPDVEAKGQGLQMGGSR